MTKLRIATRAAALTTILILSGVFVVGLVPPKAEAGDAGEDPGSPTRNDVIVELDEGEDREVHAAYILDRLDVDEDEQDDRIVCPVDECFQYAINGLWLSLTPSEERELVDLGLAGVSSVFRSETMTLPVEPFEFSDMTGRGYDYSPQIEDAGYRRIGGVPGDYGNVTIGIIDTGVDLMHDDLNVVGGYDCTYSEPGQHGANGSWGVDGHGHGTNVAGLAAAIDNDRGTVGPAAGAQIRSYKVFGSAGSASTAQVLCGVDQAMADAAAGRIVAANMSIGGPTVPSLCGGSDPYHNAICALALEIPVVVSAGNDGIDSVFKAPASFPEVITVSALTDIDGLPGRLAHPSAGCGFAGEDDARAPFSNYGSAVDFIAPGVCTFGPLPGNQYGYLSGTSMSSPHVTGVIAAHISECGELGPLDGTTGAALHGSGFESVRAVFAWSSVPRWTEGDGSWSGDVGPDAEPLVRAGAPCGYEAAD